MSESKEGNVGKSPQLVHKIRNNYSISITD